MSAQHSPGPRFDATRSELDVILKIVQRFERLCEAGGVRTDRMSLLMDIEACHSNGCALRLDALVAAKDSDLAHDVSGITRHLDRATGQLTDCFLPRYAAKATGSAT